MLGDAPPHDPEPVTGLTAAEVIDAALAVDPAEVYPVLVSSDSSVRDAFSPIATGTGGEVVAASGSSEVADVLGGVLEDVSRAPVAHAGGPYATAPGEEVFFSASASFDPDGRIDLYEWDLDGDGFYEISVDGPSHVAVLDAERVGVVSVRVTDDSGLQTVGQASVVVAASPPTAETAPPDIEGVLDLVPVAVFDELSTNEDTATVLTVLANDTDDVTLDRATIRISRPGTGATEVVAGTVHYAPPTDWHGVDGFQYEVCDESNQCATAEVVVTVAAVNDTPVCADAELTATAGQPATIPANCSDADGDALTYELRAVPERAELSVADDGTITITLQLAGSFVVELVAMDGSNTSSASHIVITVESGADDGFPTVVVVGVALLIVGLGLGAWFIQLLRRS